MVRGGPVKRSHTVSVRLTPDELAAWRSRQGASGRRELGAWVRAVVNDAAGVATPGAGGRGRRAGDVPVVPEVNRDAYRQLAAAASNLNQLARVANATGRPAQAGELGGVVEELRQAAGAVMRR